MMEMKEKTVYKKHGNIFETIQQIKKEKEEIKEKEYQQFIKFREKCIEIGCFPIDFKIIKKLFNKLSREIDFQLEEMSKENQNEMLDFLQDLIEGKVEEGMSYLIENKDALRPLKTLIRSLKYQLEKLNITNEKIKKLDNELKNIKKLKGKKDGKNS